MVVRSDINPRNTLNEQTRLGTNKQGTFPCLNCGNCSAIIKGDHIQHPKKREKFKVRDYFTCSTAGVIYLLKCPCGLAYVGQTSRMVKTRITEHKSVIRTYKVNPTKVGERNKETGVAQHFCEAGHQISELRWQVIEKIYGHPMNQRATLLKREVFWIHKLQTLQPNGLNEECRYSLAG